MKISLTDEEKLQEFLLILPKSKIDHLWMMGSFASLKPVAVMDVLFVTGYGSHTETTLSHFIDKDIETVRVEFQDIFEKISNYLVKTLRQRILEGENSEEYTFTEEEFKIMKQLIEEFKVKYINLIDTAHNVITRQKNGNNDTLSVSFDDKFGRLKINKDFIEILKSKAPKQFEVLSVIFSFYKDRLKSHSSITSSEVAGELKVQTRDIDNTIYQINLKLKTKQYPELFDTRGKKILLTEYYELK